MNKRKITKQQQRRIAHKQAQILSTEALSGLVISNYGNTLDVEGTDGLVTSCSKRQNLGPLVPGDNVKWELDTVTNTGVVVAVLPRKSLLSRPDSRGKLHAVAANIDQMFIVIAPQPAPSQTTIDRYLLAAKADNIEPIIILNKEDLLAATEQDLLKLLAIYSAIGIKTMVISAKKLQHLSLLHTAMHNKTSVFVGQSGVGKSSIIATFLPQLDIKIGEIAEGIKQGKHTTTTAKLFHVAELQANIIDSPGMREFPLWKLDPATLADGFIEFAPFLHECKFRNCKHTTEPGCALTEAANTGRISHTRLSSYQKILAEMQQEKH